MTYVHIQPTKISRVDWFKRPLRNSIHGRASRRRRGQTNWTRSEQDASKRKTEHSHCPLECKLTR